MKALILNSGIGSRMGAFTSDHPKCMTEISSGENILSRQLKQISEMGIIEVVMTTGYYDEVLVNYCQGLNLPIHITFVHNPLYKDTNYIYSIYCAREYLDDDLILMHGDLVFESAVFDKMIASEKSCMVVSSTCPLPEKDFKAVIQNGQIVKVGVGFFSEAVAAQPFYKLLKDDWSLWLHKIIEFCEEGTVTCYAEEALNQLSGKCGIYPMDIKNELCSEIDNPEDLVIVSGKLGEIQRRTVYMCFSTDALHSGHIAIIKKARRLGRLIIGVLSDEAVAGYKHFPLMPFSERKSLFENITGVSCVVEQKTLSYKENLEKFQPTYVVHGDDWIVGFQKPIRDEVISVLVGYGGKLVEFPYSKDKKYEDLERRARGVLSIPEMRRARLKKIISMKGLVTAIEVHSGLTGLIAENTVVYQNGGTNQFDAMWISSLCDSTAKGKPDIELVDMSSRFRTVEDIMEVTTKPVLFDGDTGGATEHFVYTVRSLERMGVSMVIIRDKSGREKSSLFGNEVKQTQDSITDFCAKISAGKRAQKTQDFMVCARIESLILEQGMEEARKRAFAYVEAGADAIMIHSHKKEPNEIFEFVAQFRKENTHTLIAVIPVSFHTVTEQELKEHGINIVIYANQLTRTGFPAMQNAARMILGNHRAKECDDIGMPFEEIIRLIPEES